MSSDDTSEAEGSKRNIILGYERVAGIEAKLGVLNTKMDALSDARVGDQRQYLDHEARIRSLELTMAGIIASGSSTKGVWTWVFAAIIAVASLGVGLLNFYK